MDAVIAAGGIPQPDDPLYRFSHGGSKALIDIAGKPMIQWVLDALGNAKTIDRVVIVGLTDKSGLSCSKPLYYLSNQGRLLENLKAGTAKVLELNRRAEHVLFVSSDIPAITGRMVDWVVDTCLQTHDDLYYNAIQRESMEAVFPTSHRTYTRLKDLQLCGGDMNMARTAIVTENSEFWNKVLDAAQESGGAGLVDRRRHNLQVPLQAAHDRRRDSTGGQQARHQGARDHLPVSRGGHGRRQTSPAGDSACLSREKAAGCALIGEKGPQEVG